MPKKARKTKEDSIQAFCDATTGYTSLLAKTSAENMRIFYEGLEQSKKSSSPSSTQDFVDYFMTMSTRPVSEFMKTIFPGKSVVDSFIYLHSLKKHPQILELDNRINELYAPNAKKHNSPKKRKRSSIEASEEEQKNESNPADKSFSTNSIDKYESISFSPPKKIARVEEKKKQQKTSISDEITVEL